MSNQNIGNQVLDAVELLVDNKINNMGIDKIVEGQIISIVDTNIGKYKIKYQGSIFYAFAQDVNKIYSNKTKVYVLVPKGDFSNIKTILGASFEGGASLGEDYKKPEDTPDEFLDSGIILLDLDKEIGLCSYNKENEESGKLIGLEENRKCKYQKLHADSETKISYKRNKQVLNYLEETKWTHLCLKGVYKINLDETQLSKNGKEFGIAIGLSTGKTYKKIIINHGRFEGDPFFTGEHSFVEYVSIPEIINYDDISWVVLYKSNFNEGDIITPDIFMEKLKISLCRLKTENEKNRSIELIFPKGIVFTGDINQLEVRANLYEGSKILSAENIPIYWGREYFGEENDNEPFKKSNYKNYKMFKNEKSNTYNIKVLTVNKNDCNNYFNKLKCFIPVKIDNSTILLEQEFYLFNLEGIKCKLSNVSEKIKKEKISLNNSYQKLQTFFCCNLDNLKTNEKEQDYIFKWYYQFENVNLFTDLSKVPKEVFKSFFEKQEENKKELQQNDNGNYLGCDITSNDDLFNKKLVSICCNIFKIENEKERFIGTSNYLTFNPINLKENIQQIDLQINISPTNIIFYEDNKPKVKDEDFTVSFSLIDKNQKITDLVDEKLTEIKWELPDTTSSLCAIKSYFTGSKIFKENIFDGAEFKIKLKDIFADVNKVIEAGNEKYNTFKLTVIYEGKEYSCSQNLIFNIIGAATGGSGGDNNINGLIKVIPDFRGAKIELINKDNIENYKLYYGYLDNRNELIKYEINDPENNYWLKYGLDENKIYIFFAIKNEEQEENDIEYLMRMTGIYIKPLDPYDTSLLFYPEETVLDTEILLSWEDKKDDFMFEERGVFQWAKRGDISSSSKGIKNLQTTLNTKITGLEPDSTYKINFVRQRFFSSEVWKQIYDSTKDIKQENEYYSIEFVENNNQKYLDRRIKKHEINTLESSGFSGVINTFEVLLNWE